MPSRAEQVKALVAEGKSNRESLEPHKENKMSNWYTPSNGQRMAYIDEYLKLCKRHGLVMTHDNGVISVEAQKADDEDFEIIKEKNIPIKSHEDQMAEVLAEKDRLIAQLTQELSKAQHA